jgi:hypothetical protein
MYNLMIYSKDQIKRVCTVIREDALNPIPISMEQEQLLTAMRYWVKTRVRPNHDINPNLFIREIAISKAIKMVNAAEEVISEKESDVKMPEKFKITSKWIVFSEMVDTYLNRLRGQRCRPLTYIIRTIENPVPGTIYQTEQELLVATAPLTGDQFDLDNERVYGVIKQLILEGPAWAYITGTIDHAKNGRATWLALRGHYHGESFLNKQKEKTYKAIEAVQNKGEHSTFTFEHFCGILTKAYNNLQHYGEPVLEVKKVRDLAINFLAESIETLDKSKPRMIDETQSSNQYQQGRGRINNSQSGCGVARNGRGRGNGGRFNRGGCRHGGYGRGGRGHGRGRNDDPTSVYIPPAEWNAMTAQQHQKFLQTQAASHISALTSIITPTDDVSAITTPTNIQVPTQIAQVHQGNANGQQGQMQSSANTAVTGPFGGRAAHRG